MNVCLVSVLGESPGVVTEALEWIRKWFKGKILNIVFYTTDKSVIESVKLLKKALRRKDVRKRIGNVKTRFIKLPMIDIKEEKDAKELWKSLKKALRKPKGEYIFNVSGGRRLMCILLFACWQKIVKRGYVINVISYLPREEMEAIREVVVEKARNNLRLSKEDVYSYFFSKGKYKVFKIKI